MPDRTAADIYKELLATQLRLEEAERLLRQWKEQFGDDVASGDYLYDDTANFLEEL